MEITMESAHALEASRCCSINIYWCKHVYIIIYWYKYINICWCTHRLSKLYKVYKFMRCKYRLSKLALPFSLFNSINRCNIEKIQSSLSPPPSPSPLLLKLQKARARDNLLFDSDFKLPYTYVNYYVNCFTMRSDGVSFVTHVYSTIIYIHIYSTQDCRCLVCDAKGHMYYYNIFIHIYSTHINARSFARSLALSLSHALQVFRLWRQAASSLTLMWVEYVCM